MKREKQMWKAAQQIVQEQLRVTDDFFLSHGKDEMGWIVDGMKWADNNPQDESQLIIDLIHQRSVAFDEAREYRQMFEVAEKTLKEVQALDARYGIQRSIKKAFENIEIARNKK